MDLQTQTTFVLYGLVFLTTLPLIVTPVIVGMNYWYKRGKTAIAHSSLSFQDIQSHLRNSNTPADTLQEAVKSFSQHYATMPTESSSNPLKESLALYSVLLESLSKQQYATQTMIKQLGNAIINSNPVFKDELEKKLSTVLARSVTR